MAVADVVGEIGPPITVVSLHAVWEGGGWAIRTIHRQISDLMYLFADRFRPRKAGPVSRMVVAGDFNITTQLDPPWDQHARELFRRLELFGFTNPLLPSAEQRGRLPGCPCQDDPCPHFETWRRRPAPGKKPYQIDYLYLSPDLEVEGAAVGSLDHAYSDHAPLVVDVRS